MILDFESNVWIIHNDFYSSYIFGITVLQQKSKTRRMIIFGNNVFAFIVYKTDQDNKFYELLFQTVKPCGLSITDIYYSTFGELRINYLFKYDLFPKAMFGKHPTYVNLYNRQIVLLTVGWVIVQRLLYCIYM